MARATLDLETHTSRLEAAIESIWFRNLITALIILNAIVLGVLTYQEDLPPALVVSLNGIDRAITYIFAVEIFLKLVVYRLLFFRSGWNRSGPKVRPLSLTSSNGSAATVSGGTSSSTIWFTKDEFAPFSSRRRTR